MNITPPEIRHVLVRLKRWIRRYVLVEGIAATIALACLLFWLTYGIDFAYFQLSQLELPHWFRVVCTVLMTMLIAGVAIVWLGARLFRRMKEEDLALALERKFPELNDRLITAVQMSERHGSPTQSAMVERATQEAVSKLSTLELKQTINPVPLKRMVTIAGVLLASVLGMGIANGAGVERWVQAYLLGRDDYWEPYRQNELKVQILAGVEERVRNFDTNGIYKHPRGADLQILATVPENAVSPDRVRMKNIGFSPNGIRRAQVSMSRMGESEFRHTLTRVIDDQQLWFRGGDYVNRLPFRVQVVDAPRIDSVSLRCDYPSYTGMDNLEDRDLRISGMQVALPMETQFDLKATANKPLRQVKVRTPNFELTLGGEQPGTRTVQLTLIDTETSTSRTVLLDAPFETFFETDLHQFRVPMVITTKAKEQLTSFVNTATLPLPVVADETVQITLLDDDMVESQEPATLTISGIIDQPPIVETRRTGVGTVVTRNATIPLEGKITDDYGVASAWFSYRTNDNLDERRQPLNRQPEGQKEFRLQQASNQPFERLNLIPLKLEVGQILTMSVFADDGDTLNGPHISHGEMFTFHIVSTEELLAKLFDREVALRTRFEQIRSDLQELQKSLQGTRDQVSAYEKAETKPESELQIVTGYIDRALHQVRKSHTENRSIELSFRDMRDEMVNNRIDTAELLERIERRIIEPMSLLNTADFFDIDRQLGTFRLAVERQTGMEPAADECLASLARLMLQIDAILAEMRDRGTINDLIQGLQDIINREKQLLDQIEEKRIEDSFFGPAK
ncbi:MAG TPA: hypothetical protein VNQ76_04370 [Planctomicrobium sp.]|nr:hypothetical protein [Planctomicrobium sp.]